MREYALGVAQKRPQQFRTEGFGFFVTSVSMAPNVFCYVHVSNHMRANFYRPDAFAVRVFFAGRSHRIHRRNVSFPQIELDWVPIAGVPPFRAHSLPPHFRASHKPTAHNWSKPPTALTAKYAKCGNTRPYNCVLCADMNFLICLNPWAMLGCRDNECRSVQPQNCAHPTIHACVIVWGGERV